MNLLISRFLIASFLPVAMLASSCVPTPGMRLFRAEYRINSRLLLAASYDESDAVPVTDLWKSLAEAPMFTDDQGTPIASTPGDPLKATLTGTIEVRLVHAGNLLSTATVNELRLVRDNPAESAWHLAPGQPDKLTAVATY